MDTYGKPDEATPSRLIWFDNGPWKRSILYRDGTPHQFPKEHSDLFEQTIDYGVDPEHYDDLGRFDGSVHVDRTTGNSPPSATANRRTSSPSTSPTTSSPASDPSRGPPVLR